MTEFLTRAELAKRLRISQRTLVRKLPEVPRLSPVKIGNRYLFSPEEVQRIEDTFRCPLSSASAATSGMRVELSELGRSQSRLANTARDAFHAERLKQKQAAMKQRLEQKSSQARKAARGN